MEKTSNKIDVFILLKNLIHNFKITIIIINNITIKVYSINKISKNLKLTQY